MTFIARPIAPFSVDILATDDPSSFSAGYQIPCSGTPTNTRATVNAGQITVYAGSHWRLEYSARFFGPAPSYETQFEIQFYDITNSSFIGQSCWGTTPNQNAARKGRLVCTALILDSQINTSITVETRVVYQVNMGSASAFPYYGTPTCRIMELPA